MFSLSETIDSEFVALWKWVCDIQITTPSSHLSVINYLKKFKLPVYKKVNFGAYILIDRDNGYIDSLSKLSGYISTTTGNFIDNAFANKHEKEFIFVNKNDIALLNQKVNKFGYVNINPYPPITNNHPQYHIHIEPTPATHSDNGNNGDNKVKELTQRIQELERQNQQLAKEVKAFKQAEKDHQATIEKLENELEKMAGVLNKPLYATPSMAIMNDVINEFWLNHTDDKIPTKQAHIVKWIINKYGVSEAIALSVDKITRPQTAKLGKARKI